MSSLYAQYISEREGSFTIEKEFGFATYKIFDKAAYIVDVYVAPEKRRTRMAYDLSDEICAIAKAKGIDVVYGSCDVTAVGATESILMMANYGMKVDSIAGNLIYFKKLLGGD